MTTPSQIGASARAKPATIGDAHPPRTSSASLVLAPAMTTCCLATRCRRDHAPIARPALGVSI